MSDYLIQSRNLKNHIDPDFRIPAYGDGNRRGATLARDIEIGDYLFFHETIGVRRYLLGYISVKEILSGEKARHKYNDTPCDSFDDQWVFMGDKARSLKLGKPLPFTRDLVSQLSLQVDYSGLDRGEKSELQVLLALRSHRALGLKDREILLQECKKRESDFKAETPKEVLAHLYFCDPAHDVVPINEIHKMKEKQIEDLLAKTPKALGGNYKVIDKQKLLPSRDRLDLLLEDENGVYVVCEIKAPGKYSDGDAVQLYSYIREVEGMYPQKNVRGMLVNDGNVSPRLRSAAQKMDIELRAYGVKIATISID